MGWVAVMIWEVAFDVKFSLMHKVDGGVEVGADATQGGGDDETGGLLVPVSDR